MAANGRKSVGPLCPAVEKLPPLEAVNHRSFHFIDSNLMLSFFSLFFFLIKTLQMDCAKNPAGRGERTVNKINSVGGEKTHWCKSRMF